MKIGKLKTWFVAIPLAICVNNFVIQPSENPFVIAAQASGDRVQVNNFGCTGLLMKFKKEHQTQKYAAFAKGRAFTITGMMGCGAVWNRKSQSQADKAALDRCRKHARNPEKCYISHRTK